MKKVLGGDANTARWQLGRAKKIAPPQTPFPVVRDGQNLISWRWSLFFTYKPSLVRIDAHNFEFASTQCLILLWAFFIAYLVKFGKTNSYWLACKENSVLNKFC